MKKGNSWFDECYALNHMEIGTSVDYIKQNSCLFFGIAYCTLCMLYYSLYSAWGDFIWRVMVKFKIKW